MSRTKINYASPCPSTEGTSHHRYPGRADGGTARADREHWRRAGPQGKPVSSLCRRRYGTLTLPKGEPERPTERRRAPGLLADNPPRRDANEVQESRARGPARRPDGSNRPDRRAGPPAARSLSA